jgi:hypothetical protein
MSWQPRRKSNVSRAICVAYLRCDVASTTGVPGARIINADGVLLTRDRRPGIPGEGPPATRKFRLSRFYWSIRRQGSGDENLPQRLWHKKPARFSPKQSPERPEEFWQHEREPAKFEPQGQTTPCVTFPTTYFRPQAPKTYLTARTQTSGAPGHLRSKFPL